MPNDNVMTAHFDAAAEKGAEFTNLGWGQGEDFVESKTDQGVLITETKEDGTISSRWMTYAEVYAN